MPPQPTRITKDAARRRELVERAEQDIAQKLRGVCSNMPEADFNALVHRMAELEVKYRLRRETFK